MRLLQGEWLHDVGESPAAVTAIHSFPASSSQERRGGGENHAASNVERELARPPQSWAGGNWGEAEKRG